MYIMKSLQKRRILSIIVLSLLVVGILYVVEQFLGATFIEKTVIKMAVMAVIPLVLSFTFFTQKTSRILGLRGVTLKGLRPGLLLGGFAFVVVLAAYAVLGTFIDMGNIADNLQNKLGVTPANFIFVGLYVIIVNSLLEEFFFRGFVFLNLEGTATKWFAYTFSSGLFAVYHISIIEGWFNPVLMALALVTLFVTGLVLNYLNVRSGHFLNSWIAHALADAAIILIGMQMFGLI